MDEAVVRPGRLETSFYFGRLKGPEVISLVKKLASECKVELKGIDDKEKCKQASSLAVNFTGSVVRKCLLGLYTKALLQQGNVKEIFTLHHLMIEFRKLQETFLLEIPPSSDSEFSIEQLKLTSHSQVLSLIADLQPRLVLNVENLGQSLTLSEHLMAFMEEVNECAKSGGAIIILDLETLTNAKRDAMQGTKLAPTEDFPVFSASNIEIFKECNLFAGRKSYYNDENDFLVIAGHIKPFSDKALDQRIRSSWNKMFM